MFSEYLKLNIFKTTPSFVSPSPTLLHFRLPPVNVIVVPSFQLLGSRCLSPWFFSTIDFFSKTQSCISHCPLQYQFALSVKFIKSKIELTISPTKIILAFPSLWVSQLYHQHCFPQHLIWLLSSHLLTINPITLPLFVHCWKSVITDLDCGADYQSDLLTWHLPPPSQPAHSCWGYLPLLVFPCLESPLFFST